MQLTPHLLVLFLAASTSNQVGQALFGFTLFLITLSLGYTGYVARVHAQPELDLRNRNHNFGRRRD